ncbi:putative WRKY transcription factor 53 [Morella rubra]|uniref:Putative WRKY transcription factor 53 n=1 Tax=Morella rubra TaxID=262757 RepID=A0A6A1W3V5_9ROSI|nr:putative WRKY transcription factor 53 [Morella rubra]
MEKTIHWESKTLLSELNQGKELAKQLMNHLHPSSSHETREFLVEKILSSYEKALSSLNWGAHVGEPKPSSNLLESPSSFANGSPWSEGSDQDSKHKDVSKKRKTLMPRWTEQMKVRSGTGLEGPLGDGYSWRKYGQKDILGANFPRSYYRCSHRHGQGCLATKQVQKSEEDPTIFEVTYKGRHTCSQASRLNMAAATVIEERLKEKKSHFHPQQRQHEEKPLEEIVSMPGAGLMVKTEDLDTREDDVFPYFSFPTTPIGSENVDNNIFSEAILESNFCMGSLSPTFISPATSDSNMFSLSPCHMNSYGLGHNVQTSESDLTDIISAPTSVPNSPIGNLDLSLDLDPDFPFDIREFFS